MVEDEKLDVQISSSFFFRPSGFDVSLSEVLKQEPFANIVRRGGTSLPGNEKGRKPIKLGPLPKSLTDS
jgi:hypothetical protein